MTIYIVAYDVANGVTSNYQAIDNSFAGAVKKGVAIKAQGSVWLLKAKKGSASAIEAHVAKAVSPKSVDILVVEWVDNVDYSYSLDTAVEKWLKNNGRP